MIVEFVMGRYPSGEFQRVAYNARIAPEVEEFNFHNGPKRIGENIGEILRQYARLDEIRTVQLTAQEHFLIGHIKTFLDATVLLFPHREIINWTARTAIIDCPHLAKQLLRRYETYLNGLKLVVAGTARSVLPELKEQARQEIRNSAERRARHMMANAEAILTYLDRPF